MKAHAVTVAATTLLIAALFSVLQLIGESPPKDESTITSLGDVQTLLTAYHRWKATRNGADRNLVLPLSYSKGLSAEFTKAHGNATLDLIGGSLSVEVSGLSDEEAFDVWLIDNRPGPGHSVKPEAADAMVRVGRLKHREGTATLQAPLGREALPGFEIDLVVVARAGEVPGEAGLLFGSASLFQRLYYSETGRQLARFGEPDAPSSRDRAGQSLLSAPLSVLIPSPVYADETGGDPDLEVLIATGEDIFFNETFDGNGRTCGTCHPAENNFTIDPDFIATLPPDDPLFVAEFIPALSNNFEKPQLMRQFGLILENADGVDDLENKFVMRGVPHTLALSTSIASGSTDPPLDRTGWSGDGAPGSGTLREFSIGAIFQHFTKTLNRIPGVDFRLPNDAELDALAAFMLSLGRQEDLDLSTLNLKGEMPELGRQRFLTKGKCNICHRNAGANSIFDPDVNANFDAGIEDLGHPARSIENFPCDGGSGRAFNPACGTGGDGTGFGDGTFNTPPLPEAADTGPFFHNNVINTIEEAVAFYTSTEFNLSSGGGIVGGIQLDGAEITAIAAFLRVLNVLENIRSANVLEKRALSAHAEQSQKLLGIAQAELTDAIAVLTGGELHPVATERLKIASSYVTLASIAPSPLVTNQFITLAIAEQEAARNRIVTTPVPILTAPGPGLGAHIRGFTFVPDEPGGVVPTETSFFAYPSGVDLGANVTPCDVDGDGTLDLVTGPGPGPVFGADVRGFRLDGTPIPGLSFLAYPAGVGFGVKVACGDLDGDGTQEIITGPGPGPGFGAHVRAFRYDSITQQVQDTGVSFLAYPVGVDMGVNVAAGDLDGNGRAEILTGPGPRPGFGAHIRAFAVNTTGGLGNWTVTPLPVSFLAYPSGVGFGVNVAAGDLDEDGKAEILAGPGPGDGFGAHVRAFAFTPQQPGGVTDTGVSFLAYPPGVDFGVRVTTADLDADGKAEIVTGPGPRPFFGSHVRAFAFAPGQPGGVADTGVSFLAYQPGVGFGASFGSGSVVP